MLLLNYLNSMSYGNDSKAICYPKHLGLVNTGEVFWTLVLMSWIGSTVLTHFHVIVFDQKIAAQKISLMMLGFFVYFFVCFIGFLEACTMVRKLIAAFYAVAMLQII